MLKRPPPGGTSLSSSTLQFVLKKIMLTLQSNLQLSDQGRAQESHVFY